jgi:hypothetical protein
MLVILASMSLLVKPPAREAAPGPDQGVIEDARKRQRDRRRRGAAVALALLAAGTMTAAIFGGKGSKPGPQADSGARHRAAARAKQQLEIGAIHISPALEGGSYGWCLTDHGGGSCATVLTHRLPMAGELAVSADNVSSTALIAPEVAGVLANGRRARMVDLHAHLPYGLRFVQITLPRTSPEQWHGANGPAAPRPPAGPGATAPVSPTLAIAPPTLLAIDSRGEPLTRTPNEEPVRVGSGIRWWERPEPLPPGPCQIRAHGLAGLTPEWGHVASAIRAYPEEIVGRTFFSCIDVEYYLHNWPLESAILLDAAHPGSPPAPIPGMQPVAGAPSLFNSPGDWHGEITAIRHGNAWLVVAGGSGLTQRIDVLRHITTTIKA